MKRATKARIQRLLSAFPLGKSVYYHVGHRRLNDERKELLQAQLQLLEKVKLIEEARKQLDTVHALIAALPEVLADFSKEGRSG
jgi:hypothetical protein